MPLHIVDRSELPLHHNSDVAYTPIQAECILYNLNKAAIGCVKFREDLNTWTTYIEIKVWRQTPGLHGIHIHEYGQMPLTKEEFRTLKASSNPNNGHCADLGGHYDPYQATHGGLNDDFTNRHIGDMGNIQVLPDGSGHKEFFDRLIRLRGRFNVLGRSVVFHADPDDLGKGHNHESHITGNSGARIACGIIRQTVPQLRVTQS